VGFPLLNMELHVQLFSVVNPMFIIGFIFMVYSLTRLYPRYRYLWILVVISAIFSSYRIYLGIAVITWMWLELNSKKTFSAAKFIAIILFLITLSGVFVYTGYLANAANSGSWSLDPMKTLEYRLALTMGIFNDIVGISFPAGKTFGQSITMEATEFTCRVLYGCTSRITSTAFGEAMLDFGLLGVFLVSWFAGIVLGNLQKKDFGLYAFLFASLVVSLDVGINIFLILEYIYLGWARLVMQWKV
jgi:hypothetical protein